MEKPVITYYAKRDNELIIHLQNGRNITLPYNERIEKEILDIINYNINIGRIIDYEKNYKIIENGTNYGNLAIFDLGMIYSFMNGTLPGLLFFLLAVSSATYVAGKCVSNDENFESRVNYFVNKYKIMESDLINKLNEMHNKNIDCKNLGDPIPCDKNRIKEFEDASERFEELVKKGLVKHRGNQLFNRLSSKNNDYEISDDSLNNENAKKKVRTK